MKAPKNIFLQVGDSLEDSTWDTERVGMSDVEYVRADLVAGLLNELDALTANVTDQTEVLRAEWEARHTNPDDQ